MLGKLIGLVVIVVVAIALLLPVQRQPREAARRTQCKGYLKQIALALHNYESTYGAFPPAFTVDADGKPLHSWRTLILPYLNQQPLYDKIDLSKAWDDPVNQEAIKGARPYAFVCPSTSNTEDQTTYLAVVTEDSCIRPGGSCSLADITDSRSETLMVLEVPPSSAVHWMSPVDADDALILGIRPETKVAHVGGVNVLMVDGTVHFISASLSNETRRALISVSGHEQVGDF